MYTVGDVQWHMPQWGIREERRICAMYTVGTLVDTFPSGGLGEEKGICSMYTLRDAQ